MKYHTVMLLKKEWHICLDVLVVIGQHPAEERWWTAKDRWSCEKHTVVCKSSPRRILVWKMVYINTVPDWNKHIIVKPWNSLEWTWGFYFGNWHFKTISLLPKIAGKQDYGAVLYFLIHIQLCPIVSGKQALFHQGTARKITFSSKLANLDWRKLSIWFYYSFEIALGHITFHILNVT